MLLMHKFKTVRLLCCALLLAAAMAGVAAAEAEWTELITPAETNTPVKLMQGGTLGQDFVALQPFNELLLPLPAYSTTDSGFTFSLRRHGPNGELLYQEVVRNAVDNITVIALPETLEIGRYYAEISEVAGDIGWWSRQGGYARGTAYADGQHLPAQNRMLQIRWN